MAKRGVIQAINPVSLQTGKWRAIHFCSVSKADIEAPEEKTLRKKALRHYAESLMKERY